MAGRLSALQALRWLIWFVFVYIVAYPWILQLQLYGPSPSHCIEFLQSCYWCRKYSAWVLGCMISLLQHWQIGRAAVSFAEIATGAMSWIFGVVSNTMGADMAMSWIAVALAGHIYITVRLLTMPLSILRVVMTPIWYVILGLLGPGGDILTCSAREIARVLT